jgi:hypothetical protein
LLQHPQRAPADIAVRSHLPALAAAGPVTLKAVISSRSAWAFVPLLLLACACGPTERESGHAILLMAPLITLGGVGVASLFRALWKPLVSPLSQPLRDCRNLMIALVLACLPLFFDKHLNDEWLLVALHAVGTSYLTFLLIGVRLSLSPRNTHLFRYVTYLPWLVLYPPALYFAYVGSTTAEASDFPLQLWWFPGYAGLITGPLFLLLLVEVLVRRYSHHKRLAAEALPRPLPVATARKR